MHRMNRIKATLKPHPFEFAFGMRRLEQSRLDFLKHVGGHVIVRLEQALLRQLQDMAFLLDTRIAVEDKTATAYERMCASFKHAGRVMRHTLAKRTHVDQHDARILSIPLKGSWIIQEDVKMITLVTRRH